MSLNVLIAPDKFKGTLTAKAAAKAIGRGWAQARPGDALRLLPMSDGGDGFGEVIGSLSGARVQAAGSVDAAHRPCAARWWWEAKSKTAIIESASVIGLVRLPSGKFHPFELDTFGLGALLKAAANKGAVNCLIGIGGSATNDGGFGLARSLGWTFLDSRGDSIERWNSLHRLVRIRAPRRRRYFRQVSVAVDVQNLLLGRHGASRVYGPQKGLRPQDFNVAERSLRRLATVVSEQFGVNFAKLPGSGAAGGLGFGLTAFLGARLENGFELFATRAALRRQLQWADLVVTGEGRLDHSTLMGKGVGEIARLCAQTRVPCIGLAGIVALPASQKRFARTYALTRQTTAAQATARPAFWLQQTAKHAADVFAGSRPARWK